MKFANIGWIIGTGLLMLASTAWGVQVEARLDREWVRPGESVELTLRVRGGDGSESPDLTPLERDFRVLEVGRSLRSRMLNGQYDSRVDWVVSLLPRQLGRLEVPSLEVSGAHTRPRFLEVSDSIGTRGDGVSPPSASASGGPAVFLETEVDESSPYVQAEVALRVRLFADARVRGGALSDPVADGAVVERVGEDRQYRERREGSDYAVVERRYAIFPQRSGQLEVAPAVFQGKVREERTARRRRGDAFGGLRGAFSFHDAFAGGALLDGFFGGGLLEEMLGGGGRPVRVASQSLSLDVRPRPADSDATWWIPARDVELVERWAEDPPSFRVGEPVERLVAIRARGISVSQLPELELPSADGFKQYSEAVADETIEVENEVVAIRARNSTLIPIRAGTLTLPAVELEWWDTRSEEPRTARLAARQVEVLPAPGAAAGAGPSPGGLGDSRAFSQRPAPASNGTSPARPDAGDGSALNAVPASARVAAWFAAVLLAAGLGWGVARRIAVAGAGDARGMSLARAERSLRSACRSNDPSAAAGALAKVGAARWPGAPPLDAGDWARRLGGGGLAAAVETLQRVRYSPEARDWEGIILWQAYEASRRVAASTGGTRKRSVLPDLYPAREPSSVPR